MSHCTTAMCNWSTKIDAQIKCLPIWSGFNDSANSSSMLETYQASCRTKSKHFQMGVAMGITQSWAPNHQFVVNIKMADPSNHRKDRERCFHVAIAINRQSCWSNCYRNITNNSSQWAKQCAYAAIWIALCMTVRHVHSPRLRTIDSFGDLITKISQRLVT